MPGKAKLSIIDQRRAARRRIEVEILGHHRARGDIRLRLVNISTDGFSVRDFVEMDRGDRLMIRLPIVGYRESFCLWVADGCAGLQFERPIRMNEFSEMMTMIQGRQQADGAPGRAIEPTSIGAIES
ncbi:MAG TPA: PilZ domain-containing protein [Sphingomicrobium sp.]|nr:PilZ domain-containing protein [Sphingomicrobium sp.]